jgi:hypothetical protein
MNSTLTIFLEWIQASYGFFLACAGLLSLACFVAFMEFRQDAAKHKKQQQWLDGFDFQLSYFEEVQKRYPHLTPDDITQAFEQLRAYFLLCWQRSPQAAAMPDGMVDACWQVMILQTRQYHKFCHCAFGRYLHHEPHGLAYDLFTNSNDLAARGRPRELM